MLSLRTRIGIFVLLIIGALFISITPSKAATISSSAPSAQACAVSGEFLNIGHGPFIRITETGTCTETDIVSLALWYASSVDGNPISTQERVVVFYDQSMPVGTYDVDIPYIADGACFWQVDLAWGHAPDNLSTPYGDRLIHAWHGGSADCITKTTAPPTPSATVTTPVPVPSATTAAPTTAPVPSVTVTTPAPTTPVATPTKPKPTPTHHKPKPKPTHHKPTHHKPSPKPSASGCVASGCDKPTPAPTTSAPTKPQLPMTGSATTAMVVVAVGLISAGVVFLLVLSYFRRRDMLQ